MRDSTSNGTAGITKSKLSSPPRQKQLHVGKLGSERFHAGAEAHLSAAGGNVVAGPVVKLRQRNRGNAHAPGGARFQKRLAHHLGGVRNRDPVDLFVQGADQDCFPEAIDGALGLAVAAQPLQE